ncbi:MAG: glycosyltransferase [Bacteroidetes bacterium]|nr:MAG: glycosyltransferase [Bacteroidota bacterium]
MQQSPEPYLHVISFDIPYPANYGGVIVIYHQLRALHALGIKVLLHCFQYNGRTPSPELEQYCAAVYYYPRDRSLRHQFSPMPFIMHSRQNKELLHRLLADDHPILFEGMHTAAFIGDKRLGTRRKIIRMHNIEWQYYRSLSGLTDTFTDKVYYRMESSKLRMYETRVLRHADAVITLSDTDQQYFRQRHPQAYHIPVFHPNDKVECLPGNGGYVLFHGKLSVPDNEQAAIWLIKEVFSNLHIPFVIAGLAPGIRLKELVRQYQHIRLVEDPDEESMTSLIRDAHINLLVSFQAAGFKLKLINALFRGRFCVVNMAMVSGTGLHPLCIVRDSPAEFRQTLEALMNTAFSTAQVEERRSVLQAHFANSENARKLAAVIWERGFQK